MSRDKWEVGRGLQWAEAVEKGAFVLSWVVTPVLLSVFSQGDKGTSWYIIWKGSVNVVTHGKVRPGSLLW